jgi:hypothetical protein
MTLRRNSTPAITCQLSVLYIIIGTNGHSYQSVLSDCYIFFVTLL